MRKKLTFPCLSIKLATSAWCKRATKHIEMDVRLAKEFQYILDKEMSKPNLGCATTGQLIAELKARSNLKYSTVFYEECKTPCTKVS